MSYSKESCPELFCSIKFPRQKDDVLVLAGIAERTVIQVIQSAELIWMDTFYQMTVNDQ